MAYYSYKPSFGVGARVRVVKQLKYPGENLIGLVGTVRYDSGKSVAVVLDNARNHRSSYYCFYFKPIELVKIDENMEENNMNNITNYLNIARVKAAYGTNQTIYEYANFNCGLGVGDICVVTSDVGLVVAKVVEIVDRNDLEIHQEVVAKVYTDEYDQRVKNRAKIAELRAKMQERAKQLQDIALYQMLAKDDPEMMALLEEYQSLPNY